MSNVLENFINNVINCVNNNENFKVSAELTFDNVHWDNKDNIIIDNKIITLKKYNEYLEREIDDLLLELKKMIYNSLEIEDDELLDFACEVELSKGSLIESLAIIVTFYKELQGMEKIIIMSLFSAFGAGFLGYGFTKIFSRRKDVDKECEARIRDAELQYKAQVKIAELQYKTAECQSDMALYQYQTEKLRSERISKEYDLNLQKAHELGQRHVQKIERNLGAKLSKQEVQVGQEEDNSPRPGM